MERALSNFESSSSHVLSHVMKFKLQFLSCQCVVVLRTIMSPNQFNVLQHCFPRPGLTALEYLRLHETRRPHQNSLSSKNMKSTSTSMKVLMVATDHMVQLTEQQLMKKTMMKR